MLKSLQNLVSNSAGYRILGLTQSTSKFSTNTCVLLNKSASKKSIKKENEDEEDEFNFLKSSAGRARILERFGIIRSDAKWPQYNRIIYPPSEDGKPTKNPYIHHMRNMIKYPPEKLWFPAFMIRGLSIDEAIKQLSFHKLKGAAIIKDVLLEAQELAVKQHNIEFKSNLWISYSSSSRAMTIKGVRKHRGPRIGMVEYKYSNYYVRLEEGQPPSPMQRYESETYEARAKEYIEKLRNRTIHLTI